MKKTRIIAFAVLALAPIGLWVHAAGPLSRDSEQRSQAEDLATASAWEKYTASPAFTERSSRCGTPEREAREALYGLSLGDPSDCNSSSTNPLPDYDPGQTYTIDVVVHILMNDACSVGDIPDPLVQTQIDILNEDFLALTGTPGEFGTYSAIEFRLAPVDPDGDPTTGITRTCNTTWYNDNGTYWTSLNWDPNRYMNIYTNTAGGFLGYVPFLPADGGGSQVGLPHDRVVILWSAFGRNAPTGPPYDQGRTATHEVGHYLGLEHTFNGSCGTATPPGCYTTGDLICDTNSESTSHFGCSASSTCGTPDPIENYMDYTDDTCMELFSVEQTRRTRCTLANYRDELNSAGIFTDGFESGNTTAWTTTVP